MPTRIIPRANDDRFLRCLNANVVAVFNGVISLLACSLPFVGVLSVMLRSITDVIALSDRLANILREMVVHFSW